MRSAYHRFSALDSTDRRLVLEAGWLMALVWTGLRLIRLSTLRWILDRYVRLASRRNTGRHPCAVGRVRWAIAAVAARFPASATCLVQALAADAMLRRRGQSPELRLGVRIGGNRAVPLEAHAWVECDGAVVVGVIDDLLDYTVLCALRS